MTTRAERTMAAWEKTYAATCKKFVSEFDPDSTGLLSVRGASRNALIVYAPGLTEPIIFWVPFVQTTAGEIAIGEIGSWRRFKWEPVAHTNAVAETAEPIRTVTDEPAHLRFVDDPYDVGPNRRQVSVPAPRPSRKSLDPYHVIGKDGASS